MQGEGPSYLMLMSYFKLRSCIFIKKLNLHISTLAGSVAVLAVQLGEFKVVFNLIIDDPKP